MRRMDHVAIAFARVKLDADGHLADDLPCFGCDYNLRTQRPDGACSECGQEVSISLSADRLLFADHVWLGRLTRGMIWVVVGLAWQIPWSYLGPYVGPLLAWLGLPSSWAPLFDWHGYYVGLIVMLIGWWRITSPEPCRVKVARTDRPRRIVRTVLTLAIVGYYPSIYWYSQGSLPWDERFLLVQVVETLADLSYVLGILLAYHYLARLAGRVPRSDLIRHARCGMGVGRLFGTGVYCV
jgi:hypothetical protein